MKTTAKFYDHITVLLEAIHLRQLLKVNDRLVITTEAEKFYNQVTQKNTPEPKYSGWGAGSEYRSIGGFYQEGDRWIAYDFTNGDEVFIEEFDTERKAKNYACGIKAKPIGAKQSI